MTIKPTFNETMISKLISPSSIIATLRELLESTNKPMTASEFLDFLEKNEAKK